MTDKKTKRSQPTKADDNYALALPSSTGLASIFEELMRPFDQLMEPFFPRTQSFFPELASIRQPALEVQDRGDHFSLTAELPGFTKDDVEVKVGPNGIELTADKTEKAEKDGKGGYQRSSRSYFHEYLSLPGQVAADKIDGTMKNGILELRIPKRANKLESKTRRVDLK